MWGALLARILAASGMTVVVPDYRNYPWGTVPEAVDDVESALQWTLDHMASEPLSEEAEQKESESSGTEDITEASPLTEVEEARATPCESRRKKNLVVVGQSAGGHLVTTLLLRKAVEQLNTPETPNENNPDTPSSSPSFVASDVSGLISLSAPFHLEAMQDTFRRHGLGEHLVDRMFDGRRDNYDPFVILQQANEMATSPENNDNRLGDFLPPIRVYHGTRDKTVPFQGSVDFVEQLQAHNVAATYHSYDGWSHTDPIRTFFVIVFCWKIELLLFLIASHLFPLSLRLTVEGPMVADHRFHRDIFDSVLEWTPSSSRSLSSPSWPGEGADRPPPVMRKLCPHFLIKLGHFFMPF